MTIPPPEPEWRRHLAPAAAPPAPFAAAVAPKQPSGKPGPSAGVIAAWAVGGSVGLLAVSLALAFAVFVGLAPALERATAAAAAQQVRPGDSSPYTVDGVRVEPQGGWTFTLTSPEDCPAAKVTTGFADAAGDDAFDQFTDAVPLQARVPYEYTIPASTSGRPYATIGEIVCHAM